MNGHGDNFNFWQGRLVRLRGVEPSDAETFARWNHDNYGMLKEEWERSAHRI
jgi:hypothetical protein